MEQEQQDRIAAFRKDLESLLEKHKASIDLLDVGDPTSYYPTYKIVVTLPSLYDEKGNRVAEYVDFNL